MIQDIQPHRYRHDYLHEPPRPDDVVLAFEGRSVLARLSGGREISYPLARDVEGVAEAPEGALLRLFSVDGAAFYLWAAPEPPAVRGGFSWVGVEAFRDAAPQWLCFAGITGLHLWSWYSANRFCGRCGHAMRPFGPERAMECPSCGFLSFPRISPAVIVGLTDGADRIVMSRYAGRDYKDVALLAGFVEIGETPEDAVRREVAEEVGLRATNIRYAGSQPWGMDGDLLLGFYADVEGPDEIRSIDRDELAVARWVRRDEISPVPNTRTLTFDMIERFRTGRETLAPC